MFVHGHGHDQICIKVLPFNTHIRINFTWNSRYKKEFSGSILKWVGKYLRTIVISCKEISSVDYMLPGVVSVCLHHFQSFNRTIYSIICIFCLLLLILHIFNVSIFSFICVSSLSMYLGYTLFDT